MVLTKAGGDTPELSNSIARVPANPRVVTADSLDRPSRLGIVCLRDVSRGMRARARRAPAPQRGRADVAGTIRMRVGAYDAVG